MFKLLLLLSCSISEESPAIALNLKISELSSSGG